MSTEQTKLDQVIHSAETANEASLERQIQELCDFETETPEKFEFVLSEKVFQLYYGEKGHLPTFRKEQQPSEIYFIQAIEKVDEHGNYRLTTNSFATSDHIRGGHIRPYKRRTRKIRITLLEKFNQKKET